MARKTTPSFITEIPLKANQTQEAILLTRFELARKVYNAVLGESLKRLKLMRESKAYHAARKMPGGKPKSRERKAKSKAFEKCRKTFGFQEYALHAYAAQFSRSFIGEHLDCNTVQKIATRAFNAANQYAYGKKGKPKFKRVDSLDSVEGKSNRSGIRWRDEKVKWFGLELEAIINTDDPVIMHGLKHKVKYLRLVRKRINGKNRFYVQLINEGLPYQKPENKPGKGVVGLDIGPSTIAIVGPEDAALEQFCQALVSRQKEIAKLQRQIERQRRANNPANYEDDVWVKNQNGKWVHKKGKIKKGNHKWVKSSRQKQNEKRLQELHRKQAAHRASLHGQLINRILRMGDTVQLEKLSYKAFQRRFGKSVSFRAPGSFVAELRRKIEAAGGVIYEFPTRTTKLSQVCHQCASIEKKPMSQRWHKCSCGIVAQRDLYSAFLATCVVDDMLNATLANEAWVSVDVHLRAALSEIKPVNGGRLPSSFGLDQRLNRSPAKSETSRFQTPDVVAAAIAVSESRDAKRQISEPQVL